MAIGGFQQNAFQQDAFQIEASDSTYSFSNDPQFVSKVSARSTVAAALSVTFAGFVFVPPTPTIASHQSTDVVVKRNVIYQATAAVVQPPAAAVQAVVSGVATQVTVQRVVINQYNAGVPPPPVQPVLAAYITSDVVSQGSVINQTVAVALPPTTPVQVSSVFADPPVFVVSRKPQRISDGFIVTPSQPTFVSSIESEIVFQATVLNQTVSGVLTPTTVATPSAFWFGAQVEVFTKPFKREWAGFIPPPSVAVPASWSFAQQVELRKAPSRIEQPGFPVFPTAVPTPSAFWFGAQVEQIKRSTRIEQPGFTFSPTGVTTPTAFWFSEQPALLKKPTRIEQLGFTFAPTGVATPTALAFSDNQIAALFVEPLPVPTVTAFLSPDQVLWQPAESPYFIKKPKPLTFDGWTIPVPPTPVVGTPAGSATDVVFRRTVINQHVSAAPQPPSPLTVTPTAFWFGAQVELRKKPTRIEQPGFEFFPPGVPTTSSFPFADNLSPHLGTAAIMIPDGAAFTLSVATPTAFWFGAQPEKLQKPTRIEQPGFQFVPPPPFVIVSAYSSDVTFRRTVIYQANANVLGTLATTPTPTNFWFGEPPAQLKKPTRIEQPGFEFFPPGILTPSAFWFSEQPAQLKKPVPRDQAPLITSPTVPVPATWSFGPSPELLKKPVPRDQAPLTLPFPNPVSVPASWSWSPSPELIKKPTRIEQPSFQFTLAPVITPSSWPWSSSPEQIIKPKPLLTPDITSAWTFQPPPPPPGQIATSYEPGVFRQITVIYQAVGFAVRPVVITPSFFPWSPSPELLIKPLKVTLQPTNTYPAQVVPPPPIPPQGGGKRRFRRPDGARVLHPFNEAVQYRDRVIYRRDDYGLPYKVGLFESIEDLLPPAPPADAVPPEAVQPELPPPSYPQIPAGPAPQSLMGQLAPRGVFSNDQQDIEDAIAALEALQQLGDPMFNVILDHMIKLLAKK